MKKNLNDILKDIENKEKEKEAITLINDNEDLKEDEK